MIKEFKEYNLIDFNEIKYYILFQKNKSSLAFNYILPGFNELIDSLVNNKIKNKYTIISPSSLPK